MPTSVLKIAERLHKDMGDWLNVPCTTALAASTHVSATGLQQYDNAREGLFVDWWLYIPDFLNTGKDRKVRLYYTANGTCNVWGAAYTSDASNLSNVWLFRYSMTDTLQLIDKSVRELYPVLHRVIVDKSLATNSDLFEYPLPTVFDQIGAVYEVAINVSAANTSTEWKQTYIYDNHFSVINEGHTLRLNDLHSDGREIRLTGIVPLESVSHQVNTVNIAGPQLDLLIAYAKYKIYQQKQQPISSEDITRYREEEARSYNEYRRLLPMGRMQTPPAPIRI